MPKNKNPGEWCAILDYSGIGKEVVGFRMLGIKNQDNIEGARKKAKKIKDDPNLRVHGNTIIRIRLAYIINKSIQIKGARTKAIENKLRALNTGI